MKNKGLVIGISVLITVLSAYFLSFTAVSNAVQSDATDAATDANGATDFNKKQKYLDSVWNEPVFNLLGIEYTYQKIKKQELQLGLDLQGGMHVTLEVSPVEILRVLANNNTSPQFNATLKSASEKAKTNQKKFSALFYDSFKENYPGGRLSSVFANSNTRGRIEYNSTDDQVLRFIDEELDNAIERSFNIVRTRIDQFGTIQPNVQRIAGTNRIQVELPGVNNPQRVRDLLQSTANLEFWEVWELGEVYQYFSNLNDLLLKKEKLGLLNNKSEVSATAESKDNLKELLGETGAQDSTLAKNDTTKQDSAKQQNASALFARYFQFTQYGVFSPIKDTSKVNSLLLEAKEKGIFPSSVKLMWGLKAEKGMDGFLPLYAIKNSRDGQAPLNGKVITNASLSFDDGTPSISMQMNADGAKKWRKMTKENTNRRIAIALDGFILSAPNVQGEIPNGSSSITGNFSIDEAKDLANKLKSGRMPAPVKIVEEAIVGPSLGQESISQGLMSSLFGVLAVMLFMAVYYNKGGWVANLALLVNVFFIFGMMVQIPGGAVLTLPGIAGIVLTMGMSVDANVLIFERIREELRLGKSVDEAMQLGYSKAFSAIFDSNVTTLLTATILALLGTGPVQGFAVTLIIGIVTSFFTAVFVSRLILEFMLSKNWINENSFSIGATKNLFSSVNFNVIGARKKAYLASSVLIVLGIVSIVIQGGLPLGVDFKGGRSYIVEFDNYINPTDLKLEAKKYFVNAGTEVKTFGSNTKLKITTSFLADDDSNEADEKVLAGINTSLEKFKTSNPKILSSSKVGATIADEIRNKSALAILVSLALLFGYIFIRFRSVSFSAGAVIALFHDVLAVLSVLGISSLFGLVYEMDQIMVAALLTLVGYSINDTVVIFDRIREKLNSKSIDDRGTLINVAINETFSRTIITSVTVLLVLLVLYVFGGEVLAGFSFALLFGIIFGSYSTIFIASPIVLDFAEKKKKTEVKKELA
ncbi:MAG: protein translocase subunit SecDF [Cytophagales bacterium]